MSKSNSILYVCPFAHITGHPPFECTKETRILQEHGVDVELLTFCGVHPGFEVSVRESQICQNRRWMDRLRRYYIPQWIMRTYEYSLTLLEATMIAGKRPIYLRDAEPFPHLINLLNVFARKTWIVSSTGGLYTTGEGVSKWYKVLLRMTGVHLKSFYKIGRKRIQYSVQNKSTQNLMTPLLGERITVVPLGHRMEDKQDHKVALHNLAILDDSLTVLTLGANHSGKNNEVVFQALQGMTGIKAIFAGPSVHSIGVKLTELREQYQSDAIILNRQIGNVEKKSLFGAADWIMLSYNKSFASTTSMLWEAAAYGVPVIASTGNELEKMVRYWNLGLIFEAGDVRDLRLKLEMARNIHLRDSFAANCVDFIKYYSEDAWCLKTLELLEL